MLAHFRPVGNPPPPRPRNPARATSAIVSEGPISRARRRPRPPTSLARYSSREEMGARGSRKPSTVGPFATENLISGGLSGGDDSAEGVHSPHGRTSWSDRRD